MYFVLDIVDTIAFLTVMCPKLRNFVTEEEDEVDYTQMKPETVKELIDIYKKDILPWYSKILEQLYSSSNESIESENERAAAESD